jgi:hypothetical protein
MIGVLTIVCHHCLVNPMASRATEICLPYPHPGQIAVRASAKRINILAAGRRWRKTTLVMAIAVESAALLHQKIVWGCPTFDQCRVGWEETRHAAGQVAKFNQATMTVSFPGGGSILFRSLDNPDTGIPQVTDQPIEWSCFDGKMCRFSPDFRYI